MKCSKCNKRIDYSMKYCPYCSNETKENIEKNRVKEEKMDKVLIIVVPIVIIISLILSNIIFNHPKNEEKSKKKNSVTELVNSVCHEDYEVIYINEKEKSGIYECKGDNSLYYLKLKQDYVGEMYEFGQLRNEKVEEYLPYSLYLYRKSHVVDIPNELTIALEASSEEELIEKYANNLYLTIKNVNDYGDTTNLIVYYNDSFSDIHTTYDKLFLAAKSSKNNATQAGGMGSSHGLYVLYDGDPTELISTALNDNYSPASGKKAMKNSYIMMQTNDLQTKEEFINKMKLSFRKNL